LINKHISKETMRFLMGGITTAIVCWGSVVIFVELANLHYIVSSILATFIAWIYSYLINKYFVFKNNESNPIKQHFRFFLLQVILLGLGSLILFFEVHFLKFQYLLAVVLMSGLIAIINYLIMKYFIFGDSSHAG